jgi:hypothetical protein
VRFWALQSKGGFDVNVRRERTIMRLANNRLFYGHGRAMPGGLSAALAIPLVGGCANTDTPWYDCIGRLTP